MVSEGYSGIDVQLKRRHNLIPNLVSTVQGYANFERGVLEDVTRAAESIGRGDTPQRNSEERKRIVLIAQNICLP